MYVIQAKPLFTRRRTAAGLAVKLEKLRGEQDVRKDDHLLVV
jgi:hypothetical protein